RAGSVLRVVHAPQGADAADLGDGTRATVSRPHDGFVLHVKSHGQGPAHRHAHDFFAGLLDASGHTCTPSLIDADDRDTVLLPGARGKTARYLLPPQRWQPARASPSSEAPGA